MQGVGVIFVLMYYDDEYIFVRGQFRKIKIFKPMIIINDLGFLDSVTA